MESQHWREFLLGYCDIDIENILRSTDEKRHRYYPLLLDGSLLLDYNLQLCSKLLSEPLSQLKLITKGAITVQRDIKQKLFKSTVDDEEKSFISKFRVKNKVQVRLHNLPFIPELVRNRMPGCSDVGKFLLVNGTVIRTGSRRVLQKLQLWKCVSCQGTTEKEGRFELKYRLVAPSRCTHAPCKGTKFKHVSDHITTCSDYQEIKIQEKVERLEMGKLPRSMTVILEHDLVDYCKAGDDVTIYGIITQQWANFVVDTRCYLEMVILANNIEIHNEENVLLDVTDATVSRHYAFWREHRERCLVGRNIILASFCPELYQLYLVKLATLLVVLGGNTHVDTRGTKVRGESHLLLVGDPGTGKSQILKYASKLSPRSVITTGIGTTNAGLTVAAVKDGGEWMLEAGAMVLADGGVCCVDELGSIKEHDRVAIHEAMEQQSISVAKAGLICKLNTRTTVLAATNPRSRYDLDQPISVNVPIGTPLLSRFDLILVLCDDRLHSWDSLVSGHLLNDNVQLCDDVMKQYDSSELWSFDELRSYVSHVKTIRPRLSQEARELLGRYYRLQRETLTRNASRTTIRMLESLVRLSQAHAKLMLRSEVTVMDAVVTISVVEGTMMTSSLLGSVSVLHSVFPVDPQQEYHQQKAAILELLGLPSTFGQENEARGEAFHPTIDPTQEGSGEILRKRPPVNFTPQENLSKELVKSNKRHKLCSLAPSRNPLPPSTSPPAFGKDMSSHLAGDNVETNGDGANGDDTNVGGGANGDNTNVGGGANDDGDNGGGANSGCADSSGIGGTECSQDSVGHIRNETFSCPLEPSAVSINNSFLELVRRHCAQNKQLKNNSPDSITSSSTQGFYPTQPSTYPTQPNTSHAQPNTSRTQPNTCLIQPNNCPTQPNTFSTIESPVPHREDKLSQSITELLEDEVERGMLEMLEEEETSTTPLNNLSINTPVTRMFEKFDALSGGNALSGTSSGDSPRLEGTISYPRVSTAQSDDPLPDSLAMSPIATDELFPLPVSSSFSSPAHKLKKFAFRRRTSS